MENLNNEFCNFKIHSQYSICQGAVKIDQLAKYCKENKIKSVGLSDNYNLCGALEFADKISKVGTHPIIGTQINFRIKDFLGKLPLYATTKDSYKGITKLSSKSYLESGDQSEPYCNFEELSSLNKDTILLSGNHNDLFGKLFKSNKLQLIEDLIKDLKRSFKDKFYLEIQRHNEQNKKNYEDFLIKISAKLDLPLIGNNSFGVMLDNGKSLVPKPANGIIACLNISFFYL